VIDGIRQVARGCGYAVGVHGSQLRDLDLIACPWVAWAIAADLLVDALCVALELHVSLTPQDRRVRGRDEKPHGRLGWILVAFGAPGWYRDDEYRPPRMIDLSVMPLSDQR
jgi:hypothetical protein